jgi:hypothetical protein
MNDFSELENDLKALRPARPSPVLFERIEEAMADCGARAFATSNGREDRSPARQSRKLSGLRYNWFSFGIGVAAAAAAILLLLARINTDRARNEDKEIAQGPSASEARPVLPGFSGRTNADGSMSSSKFIPSGATQVVYNTRDEGLQFADGSKQPLRRLRYQTQQTWQWRNPSTGASLRVSYPSEEVLLIPVSGQ